MADRLIVQDIEAEGRIGVLDWEQARPQPIWIDVELAVQAAKAAAHDDVRQTVDYAALVERVRRCVGARPYRLLETVAEDIARLLRREFGVPEVRVRVRKRALPGIGYAAVEVERRAARRRALRRGRWPRSG